MEILPLGKAYSAYGLAFLAHKASTKTTSHKLTKSHIHCHGVPHSIASNQRNHFTENDVG